MPREPAHSDRWQTGLARLAVTLNYDIALMESDMQQSAKTEIGVSNEIGCAGTRCLEFLFVLLPSQHYLANIYRAWPLNSISKLDINRPCWGIQYKGTKSKCAHFFV